MEQPLLSDGTGAPASDRLALLDTFVQIVEAKSLSAAAVHLGTTQPTVSRRLQTLERTLGARLIRRSTQAMQLTEDGQRCYDRAKELLASWHAFEHDLRGDGNEPEGRLRVVVPHALGQHLLIEPLARYLRAYRRVTVEWMLNDRRPDFAAEAVDCAVQVGEVSDLSVVALKLSEIPRFVVAAPSVLEHQPPLDHAAQLERLPWLALGTFYRTEVLLTHAGSGEVCRVPIRPRLNTDHLYALRSAALLGLGACMASSWVVADDLAEGRLVRLLPEWQATPLPVYLVYPQAPFYPARLRRFIETMRAALGSRVERI